MRPPRLSPLLSRQIRRSSAVRSLRELETRVDHAAAPAWPGDPHGGADASRRYVLAMMPYPSGALHMGHVRVYAIADALARYHRMRGRRVRAPMGWDAFGLPAENAARARGVDPAAWTAANIGAMRGQLARLGVCFDHLDDASGGPGLTASPAYYRWTQWLFVRMLRRGLAYRAAADVHWDPVDGTVLADEQVDASGRSWRSGALAEKRTLVQWFLRITAYRDALLDGLDGLPRWPSSVKAMQRSWILGCGGGDGADRQAIDEQIANCLDGTTAAGNSSIHSAGSGPSRPTQWKASEGTRPPSGRTLCADPGGSSGSSATGRAGRSDEKSSDASPDGASGSPKPAGSHPGHGGMRDWLVSRQRRWGTPVPVVHCGACGPVGVPEGDLPVTLAQQQSGGAVPCPACGAPASRDADTLDTFVDSSWYYARLADPHCGTTPVSPAALAAELPVDTYVGGVEHAVLHLLYARFVHRFLVDELGGGASLPREPFASLLVQGVVEGRVFRAEPGGRLVGEPEAERLRQSGVGVVAAGWSKMSKSLGNGAEPDGAVARWGADALRLHVLFAAAPSVPLRWSDAAITGPHRWLRRVVSLADRLAGARPGPDVPAGHLGDEVRRTAAALAGVYEDGARLHTALPRLMALTRAVAAADDAPQAAAGLAAVARLAHPMAPHISAHVLSRLGVGHQHDHAAAI